MPFLCINAFLNDNESKKVENCVVPKVMSGLRLPSNFVRYLRYNNFIVEEENAVYY